MSASKLCVQIADRDSYQRDAFSGARPEWTAQKVAHSVRQRPLRGDTAFGRLQIYLLKALAKGFVEGLDGDTICVRGPFAEMVAGRRWAGRAPRGGGPSPASGHASRTRSNKRAAIYLRIAIKQSLQMSGRRGGGSR